MNDTPRVVSKNVKSGLCFSLLDLWHHQCRLKFSSRCQTDQAVGVFRWLWGIRTSEILSAGTNAAVHKMMGHTQQGSYKETAPSVSTRRLSQQTFMRRFAFRSMAMGCLLQLFYSLFFQDHQSPSSQVGQPYDGAVGCHCQINLDFSLRMQLFQHG